MYLFAEFEELKLITSSLDKKTHVTICMLYNNSYIVKFTRISKFVCS